jgi:hypothetical protein
MLEAAAKLLESPAFTGSSQVKGQLLNAVGRTLVCLGLSTEAIETIEKATVVQ